MELTPLSREQKNFRRNQLPFFNSLLIVRSLLIGVGLTFIISQPCPAEIAEEVARVPEFKILTPANIKQALPTDCNFVGDFQQNRHLAGMPEPLHSEGRFLYACKFGLIWQTASPIPESLIYTRGKQHFYIDDNENIKPLDGRIHTHLAQLLINLMGANTDYIDQHFTLMASAEDSNHISLLPKKKTMRRFIQSLNLTKSPTSIIIDIINTNTEHTAITITQTRAAPTINLQECNEYFPSIEKICTPLFNSGE